MPKSGHIKHVEQGHEKPEDVDFEHGKNERLTQGEHGEHGGHLAEVEVKDQALEKVDQELAQEIMDGARDNTRLLDDFLDNPDIIDDHENNPTHKVPDFKFHTEKDEFRDKGRSIINQYCKKVPADYPGPDSKNVKDNAYLITPEKAQALLNDHAHLGDIGIIDLRSSKKLDDMMEWKISGATELPLEDKPSVMLPLTDLKPSNVKDSKIKERWDRLMGEERFKSLLSKPVVIIHCLQSTSRTPAFVSGYLKYFAPPGQRVIMLEGGFVTYHKKANGAHELWNIVERT